MKKLKTPAGATARAIETKNKNELIDNTNSTKPIASLQSIQAVSLHNYCQGCGHLTTYSVCRTCLYWHLIGLQIEVTGILLRRVSP